MRKWIMSACALAWLALALVAVAGPRGTAPAQASGTVASSNASSSNASSSNTGRTVTTSNVSTSNASSAAVPASAAGGTRVILASRSAALVAESDAARQPSQPATRYTVAPGDTLSGIAAALGLRGGWPALYAANKAVIGPDPNLITAGTALTVPGAGTARYAVAPGGTLSGIAAALGLRGGWPALYAANKAVIGPDPNAIHAGTVLTVPRSLAPVAASPAPRGATPPATRPAPAGPSRQSASGHPAPSPAGQPAAGQHGNGPSGSQPAAPGRNTPGNTGTSSNTGVPSNAAAPGRVTAPGQVTPAGGMPRWLEDVLLAAGVLAATAFIAEPAAALARRRRPRGPAGPRPAPPVSPPGPGRRAAAQAARKASIILADHERLIVTYSAADHAVYVLTPPGEDPAAVLRAARLVLPEDTYEDLAGHLGVPSGWPLE